MKLVTNEMVAKILALQSAAKSSFNKELYALRLRHVTQLQILNSI